MVNFEEQRLNQVFAALSDATRRSVLAQLGGVGGGGAGAGAGAGAGGGGADAGLSVTELAQPHGMSLPGFMKHLAVLEAAGLIARSKAGRVVRCALDAAPMQAAALWIARYERFWTTQLDALDHYLSHQAETTPCPPADPSPSTTTRKKPARSASGAAAVPRPTRSGAPGPRRKR